MNKNKKNCPYKEEVTLRMILITYDRKDSLKKCLNALQNADIMGVNATLEIWIDVSKDKKVNEGVLSLAKSFKWQHGHTCSCSDKTCQRGLPMDLQLETQVRVQGNRSIY